MPLFTVILEVIRHTPHWVWAVLALLIVLGVSQLRARRLGRLPVALLPLALGGYSLWGAISLFGLHTAVVAAWALAMALTAWVARRFAWSPGIRHEPASDRFALPSSVWPLVLMLTVFAVRYSVVVTLVFHREWGGDMGFATGASAVYGVLSGLLAGRALYILAHAQPSGSRGVLGLAT
jgi:hypothetical protein